MKITKITHKNNSPNGGTDGELYGWHENNSPKGWTDNNPPNDGELNGWQENNPPKLQRDGRTES